MESSSSIVLIALAALAFTASAQASQIQAVADDASGTPVEITISTGDTGYGGSATLWLPHVWLSPDAYTDAGTGGGIGLFVLLHEVGHTTGIDDEHAADCFALAHMPRALSFWRAPGADLVDRQLETRMILASSRIAAGFNQARVNDHGVYGCQ